MRCFCATSEGCPVQSQPILSRPSPTPAVRQALASPLSSSLRTLPIGACPVAAPTSTLRALSPRSGVVVQPVQPVPRPVARPPDPVSESSLNHSLQALKQAKTLAAAQTALNQQQIATRQDQLRRETIQALCSTTNGLKEALNRWPSPQLEEAEVLFSAPEIFAERPTEWPAETLPEVSRMEQSTLGAFPVNGTTVQPSFDFRAGVPVAQPPVPQIGVFATGTADRASERSTSGPDAAPAAVVYVATEVQQDPPKVAVSDEVCVTNGRTRPSALESGPMSAELRSVVVPEAVMATRPVAIPAPTALEDPSAVQVAVAAVLATKLPGDVGMVEMAVSGNSSTTGTAVMTSDEDAAPLAVTASEMVAEALESELGRAEPASQAQVPPSVSLAPSSGDAPGRRGSATSKAAVPRAPGRPAAQERAPGGRRGSARASASEVVPPDTGPETLDSILDALTAKQIQALKTACLGRDPPEQAKKVLEATATLLDAPSKTWPDLRKLLQPNLVEKLRGANLEGGSGSDVRLRKVSKLIASANFKEDILREKCAPAVPLARWCRAAAAVLDGKAAAPLQADVDVVPDCVSVSFLSGDSVAIPGCSAGALAKDVRLGLAAIRPLPAYAVYELLSDDRVLLDSEQLPGISVTAVVKDRAAEAGLLITPNLAELGPDDLGQVSELTVLKEDVGSITFHGMTDCTGLDVVKLVHLDCGEVLVYPEPGSKPPVGQGLNKPATVTMYQCWPPNHPDQLDGLLQDPEAQDRYKRKIQKMTEEKRATFVDYNCNTGIWRFKVEHF